MVIERETAALILWAPSVSEDSPFIAPNGTVTITYSDIYGYDFEAEEAIYYWWNAIDNEGVLEAGEINSQVLTL